MPYAAGTWSKLVTVPLGADGSTPKQFLGSLDKSLLFYVTYAGAQTTDGSIFRSTDGGAVWTQVFDGSTHGLGGRWKRFPFAMAEILDTSENRIRFVAVVITTNVGTFGFGSTDGDVSLYTSSDGVTWSVLQTLYTWSGTSATTASFSSTGFVRRNGSWYVAFGNNVTGAVDGDIWRSDDDGATWAGHLDLTSLSAGGAPSPYGLGVSAAATMFLANGWASGSETQRSTDGGLTWATIPTLNVGMVSLHNMQQDSLVGITPRTGSTGGRFFVSCDDGVTWTQGAGDLTLAGSANRWIKQAVKMQFSEFLHPVSAVDGTNTRIHYSDDAGETVTTAVVVTGGGSEDCVGIELRPAGTPIWLGTNRSLMVSTDVATGIQGTRTICPDDIAAVLTMVGSGGFVLGGTTVQATEAAFVPRAEQPPHALLFYPETGDVEVLDQYSPKLQSRWAREREPRRKPEGGPG
jgi:hypothetical protein